MAAITSMPPRNPIAAANTSHDLEVVRLLLAAGADADDGESLFHATESDDLELLATLIEAGADVNGTGVLHHALDREAPAVLRLLLNRGGDPNRATSYFSSHPLLHHAIRNGRTAATVALLLDNLSHGAEIGRADGNGRTAYALAIRPDRVLRDASASTLEEARGHGRRRFVDDLRRRTYDQAIVVADDLFQLSRVRPELRLEIDLNAARLENVDGSFAEFVADKNFRHWIFFRTCAARAKAHRR